jgi:hypothetical protein
MACLYSKYSKTKDGTLAVVLIRLEAHSHCSAVWRQVRRHHRVTHSSHSVQANQAVAVPSSWPLTRVLPIACLPAKKSVRSMAKVTQGLRREEE